MSFGTSFPTFGTDTIHAKQATKKCGCAESVVPPISLSSTFKLDSLGFPQPGKGFVYGRIGNPTRECLEESIARAENANYGLAFASGMSAITALMEACLKVCFIIVLSIFFFRKSPINRNILQYLEWRQLCYLC